MSDTHLTLADLALCFEGAVPAVVATASAAGVPNITYLSRVRRVDDDHVALSNQFFSKTSQNLCENPRANLLLIDPTTYDEYRLWLRYERTERRGSIFEELREDVDALAAIEGMQDVFKLRAADIYRVLDIQPTTQRPPAAEPPRPAKDTVDRVEVLGELARRIGRSTGIDSLVTTTIAGLDDLLGYEHSALLLLDESGERLYTIGSHGYDHEQVGSEAAVGEGIVGMAAARCAPIRVGNLHQMGKYSRIVRQSFEDHGEIGPGRDIPLPGLPDAVSRLAVPAMALGELIGVLVVESRQPVAFDQHDEAALAGVATLVANAIALDRLGSTTPTEDTGRGRSTTAPAPPAGSTTHVRFFAVDGSTFLDGDYLIKGVAGRILWSLLSQHLEDGRVDFTNKEIRLDPTLELPQYRDNLESRLILLKRRLDERDAPVRIDKTGRGRFRLVVDARLDLEAIDPEQ